jgi:hypothetical protein
VVARPSRQTLVLGGALLVAVVVIAVVLGLRGGRHGALSAVTSTPTTSSSPTPTPSRTSSAPAKPKPKPVPAVNPLTGVGAPPKGPILAVKIDDTDNGRPPVGLDQADVVYIEQAEGGLTRLVAVFGTHKPTVEPVRSVRASDPELLSQYGPISLVASGGGGDSLSTLDQSTVKGVINDRGGPGFGRDGNRSAPYNLTADLSAVSSAVHTGGSRPVGFTFAAKDARLAGAHSGQQVSTVVGGTGVTFSWNAGAGVYVRTVGGSPVLTAGGTPEQKPNVLVQLCQVTVNPGDVDVAGNPSQYTHSIGSGRVVLFRNGKRIEGRWSRPNSSSATGYTDTRGTPLLLAPGGAYVVLAATGAVV